MFLLRQRVLPFWVIALTGPCLGWTPGTYPAPTFGLAVDASDRNDVVAFWHAVYVPSEAYRTFNDFAGQWGGTFTVTLPPLGVEGVNPAGLVAHTERRVNYYRAMAGVPAAVRLNTAATVMIEPADTYKPAANTTKAAAVQRSAYMIVRTFGTNLAPLPDPNAALSHSPVPGSCVGWTTAAWNANFRANLARGYYGPGAMDAYLSESVGGISSWNAGVGHRRWILNPGATNMATGDTPGSFVPGTSEARPPTNALYVVPKPEELTPGLTPFVAWPNAGFFPAPLNTRYWSLSRAGANFSAATISMTTAEGVPVAVVKQPVVGGFADNTVVWEVPESVRVKSVEADTRYNVTVSGISGAGVPTSFAYSVTLMDPNVVTSEQSLIGTAAPPTSGAAKYLFTAPSKAEAVQVNAFQPSSAVWTEGGEDATAGWVIDGTAASYELRSTMAFGVGYPGFGPLAGSKSLRLTIPVRYDPQIEGTPEQFFELAREVIPGANAKLNFSYRRGFMTPTTVLTVESSNDQGVTWSAVAGGSIVGNGNGGTDGGVTNASLNLVQSELPTRFRFRISGSGVIYSHEDYPLAPTGIFIDSIGTTNCQWLELKKTNEFSPAVKEMHFNATTAGMALANGQEWRLRMRTKLGNKWMPYGPMKAVTVTATALTGYDAWANYEYPDVTGGFTGDSDGDGAANGLEYAFAMNPRVPDAVAGTVEVAGNFLTLRRPLAVMKPGVNYVMEWSVDLGTWNTNGTAQSHSGGILTGQVPLALGAKYVRWKITKS